MNVAKTHAKNLREAFIAGGAQTSDVQEFLDDITGKVFAVGFYVENVYDNDGNPLCISFDSKTGIINPYV